MPGSPVVYDGDFFWPVCGGAGFTSVEDLQDKGRARWQVFPFLKSESTAPDAVGGCLPLWAIGAYPPAGANAAAAPGGTVPDSSTTGAFPIRTPPTGHTLHFVRARASTGTPGRSPLLLLYDYLFGVNINHATTSNPVTGVPTRYQTSALAPGNFISARVTTALGATAHNVTITYVDQDGNAAEAGSAQAIRASAAAQTIPFTAPKWFYYLNDGDTGVRRITDISLSAASSGNVDWFIGHPIALIPCDTGVGSVQAMLDGVNSMLNLERIYDGACLALMTMWKAATTLTSPVGKIYLAMG